MVVPGLFLDNNNARLNKSTHSLLFTSDFSYILSQRRSNLGNVYICSFGNFIR